MSRSVGRTADERDMKPDDEIAEDEPPPARASIGGNARRQEWWALVRTWPGLLSVAIAVTIVGAVAPWSFDGPVRLGGLEGSHDGWLAVLSRGRRDRHGQSRARRRGRQMVIAFIWAVAALYFVLRDGPPAGSHLGLGLVA